MAEIFAINLYNPIIAKKVSKLVFFSPLPNDVKKTIDKKTFNAEILQNFFGKKWKERLFIEKGAKKIPDYTTKKTSLFMHSKYVKPSNVFADDFDIDFDNVKAENIDEITKVDLSNKITYITDVTIFSYDSMLSFKEKIFVSLGIPIFRQYIYYKSNDAQKSGHSIYLNDVRYNITEKDNTENFNGIQIDKNIYNNREFLRIKTREPHKLITPMFTNQLYLIDLNYYKEAISNINTILSNNYLSDLLYYGLFCKYFPMLDINAMKTYFSSESELFLKYNFAFKQQNYLQKQYSKENAILSYSYNNIDKLFSKYNESMQICVHSIIYSTIKLLNITDMIFIRNLLNIFSCDEEYVFIIADVLKDGTFFRVTKYYTNQSKTIIENVLNDKASFTFYEKFTIVFYDKKLDELHEFNLYANGKYQVKIFFPNSVEYDFTQTLEYTKSFVNKIIAKINDNATNVFNIDFARLHEFKPENIEITNIDVSIKWNRLIEMKKFFGLNTILERYIDANIICKRELALTSPSVINLLMKKGIDFKVTKFLKRKGVEATNYYSIFFDRNSYNMWNTRYKGRVLNIENNITNLDFRLQNINDDEMENILDIILVLIEEIDGFIGEVKTIKSENLNIKKKLKEIDPLLYIFKDKNGKKYSRICQKKFRPTNIYLQEEFNNLEANKQNKLHKFINYTTNENVWYECPAKLPHLGFITGKHPKGFCLPRCKEKETDGKKNIAIKDNCMNKHSFNYEQAETSRVNTLKFGKILDIDKPGKLHPTIYKMFSEVPDNELYIIGCPQIYNGIADTYLLEIVAIAMQIPVLNLVDSLIEKNPIIQSIKNDELFDTENTEEYILNALYKTHNTKIIFFKTEIYESNEILDEKNSSVVINITDAITQKIVNNESVNIVFVVELNNNYYPLIHNTTGIFRRGDLLFDTFKYMLQNNIIITSKVNKNNAFSYSNIKKLMTGDVVKFVHDDYIKYLCCNKLCVGIYNSVNVNDAIRTTYKTLDPNNYTFNALVKFLADNNLLAKINCDIIVKTDQPTIIIKPEISCGIKIEDIYCWFSDTKYSEVHKIFPNANNIYINCNIHEVNNAITKKEPNKQEHLKNISAIYYDIYIYELLKYEIFRQILTNKDKKTHSKIIADFKNNSLHEIFQSLKITNKNDYYLLRNIINNSNNIIADINKATFNFDTEYIIKTKQNITIDKLIEYTKNIAIISDTVNTNFDVPDIIVSLVNTEDKSETLFYKDAKLKLSEKKYMEMLAQIKIDIEDNIRFLYEINNFKTFFIVNYFVFALNNKEKIKIEYY